MTYDGQIDMSIYEKYEAVFWGAFVNGSLVGCNSGHKCDEEYFRSRGIYIEPEYRGNGIASSLLNTTCAYASSVGCKYVWCMPRDGSHIVHKKVGFEITSPWFNENMEYGPNCYARKTL
jgi:GNAT superfamily N-acetyltransferase